MGLCEIFLWISLFLFTSLLVFWTLHRSNLHIMTSWLSDGGLGEELGIIQTPRLGYSKVLSISARVLTNEFFCNIQIN